MKFYEDQDGEWYSVKEIKELLFNRVMCLDRHEQIVIPHLVLTRRQ